MGNLKQRLIKAGRDYNYAEGVKVKATTAVYADQIVYVTASDGPYLSVAAADADGGATANGRLMIAKHDIPASGYGVVLPWKLVTGFNTSAGAVGDPVFLADAPGTSAASNLTLTAPTGDAKVTIVGRVTVDATAANGGAILVHADCPEARQLGGLVTAAASVEPRQPFVWPVSFPGTSGATINFTSIPFPILLLDAHIIAGDNSQPVLTVLETANLCITCTAAAASTGAIGRAATLAKANQDIAAGGTLRLTKTNGHADDIAVITCMRA
jgi:hypothetical protein